MCLWCLQDAWRAWPGAAHPSTATGGLGLPAWRGLHASVHCHFAFDFRDWTGPDLVRLPHLWVSTIASPWTAARSSASVPRKLGRTPPDREFSFTFFMYHGIACHAKTERHTEMRRQPLDTLEGSRTKTRHHIIPIPFPPSPLVKIGITRSRVGLGCWTGNHLREAAWPGLKVPPRNNNDRFPSLEGPPCGPDSANGRCR